MMLQLPTHIAITPFAPCHQTDINQLMVDIAHEFAEPIATAETRKITELARLPTDKYWVALANGKVIGTIGFTTIANKTIVLKRVFLAKQERGKGVAQGLLKTVLNWAVTHQISRIYLGIMSQFKAAQKFYANNGFTESSEQDLPIDFPRFPSDTVFYRLSLA